MTPLIKYYNSLNKILDKKERRKMCRDYMTWLRENYPNCEKHHVRTVNNAGMGMRPIDLYCIPVDKDTHMEMQSYEISVDRQLEILKSVHEMYKGIV